LSKSKYADSVVENDDRIGHVLDKVRQLGLDKDTYVFWTTDNGAWQDVYPDAGYTPFRGTKGTEREGGNRVPALAWGPGIKPGSRNYDIVGGLDYMATFAALADVTLPDKDLEGKPMIFDRYDISPILFGTGEYGRKSWFYFTENELSPGAVRVGNYKFIFNLRGDDGAATGGLAVDSNLGWKGPDKYVATVPQVFDLWADPQERYDIFMNNFTEHLDGRGHGTGVAKNNGNVYEISSTQSPKLWLHRTDYTFRLSTVSMGARATREGRSTHRTAHRELAWVTCQQRQLHSRVT